MVILCFVDGETDHYRVEKRRVGKGHATSTKIRTDVELELIGPGDEDIVLEQWERGASVLVGGCARDEFACEQLDPISMKGFDQPVDVFRVRPPAS